MQLEERRANVHFDYQIEPTVTLQNQPTSGTSLSQPKFSRKPNSPISKLSPPSPKLAPHQFRFVQPKSSEPVKPVFLSQYNSQISSTTHSMIEKASKGQGQQKIRLLKKSMKKLTKSNDKLTTQLEQQQQVGQFLVERQAYIGELQKQRKELLQEVKELSDQLSQLRKKLTEEYEARMEAERQIEIWRDKYTLLQEKQALVLEQISILHTEKALLSSKQCAAELEQYNSSQCYQQMRKKRKSLSCGKENQPNFSDNYQQLMTERVGRLQQQLRSREIEVDMLRKVKGQAARIVNHNHRLHGHNLQLLKKVNYLTRSIQRHPPLDSSFDLSISSSTSKSDISRIQ